MRAYVLQHVPFEPLGHIEHWLTRAGADIVTVELFASQSLPAVTDVDLLVAMGGPMSVNDEREHPWLIDEKQLIRQVVEADKPVLGVCLGSQLIASALGARVYPNDVKEIGWFPVTATANGTSPEVFRFPPSLQVFHWHGETFDLPVGARWLAESAGCRHQAFQVGRRAIGLQCHLETTPETAAEIVRHCRDEIVAAPFIQGEREILGVAPSIYPPMHALLDEVLTFITRP